MSNNKDNGDDMNMCKVVLVGETATGKTSIIERLVDDNFTFNHISTFIPSSSRYELEYEENKKLIMDVWDTAGQEKYRGLNKIFYKEAKIAILVFDVTQPQTFEELKKYWVTQVRETTEKDVSKNNIKIIK